MENNAQHSSVRGTAADEENDRAEAINNIQNAAYLDWPNEAGVSDPLAIHLPTHDTDSSLAV